MTLAVVGVSHHTAPVEARERFAFGSAEAIRALGSLREDAGLREAVLVSTCNRTELYFHPATDPAALEAGVAVLRNKAEGIEGSPDRYLYQKQGLDSVRHLYSVSAGLDSMVLGEAEIQGQVKAAYELATRVPVEPSMAGPVLNRLFQTALSVGGRVRSETSIAQGAASVASVAVELAGKIFGSLRSRRAMIMGAGANAELVADALTRQGVRGILVANRTQERAVDMAERLDGAAIPYDDVPGRLGEVDILVTSTAAPHAVLSLEAVRGAMPEPRGHPLLIMDLAIPRDVDPAIGSEPNVFLYNVDDLREIVDDTLDRRKAVLPVAQRIIDDEVEAFRLWYAGRQVVPLIRSLRGRWDGMRDRELQWLWQRLGHLSPDDRKMVERFSERLLSKLLHDPTVRLREGVANGRVAEFVDAVRYLHDLESTGLDLAGGEDEEPEESVPKSVPGPLTESDET